MIIRLNILHLAYDVDDTLAAYMIYAMDPGFMDFYKVYDAHDANFKPMIDMLGQQLDSVLENSGMDILQLYEAMAIK